MKIKLITTAFDPATGSFPAEPLAELEGEVISIVEHFFQHGGIPHVLLIVHYRSYREARSQPARANQSIPPAPAAAVRAELTESEQQLFDRLRAWRNGRAQADGVPPYVLLHNRQLAAIARKRPSTLAALREIEGIGEAKSGRFGKDLLTVVLQSGPIAAPIPSEAVHAH